MKPGKKDLNKLRVLFLLLSFFCFCPPTTFAEDLKIVDAKGLARALKNVSKPATVIIELVSAESKSEVPPSADLQPADGFSAGISGIQVESNKFQFVGVTAGTWEIVVRPVGFVVSRVLIN